MGGFQDGDPDRMVPAMTALAETVIWFLMGLVSIAALGLVAWISLSAWPRWVRWSLALGVLAVSTVITDSVALLLMAMTFMATFSLPARIALRDRPTWVKWTVAFGVISLVAALQLTSSRYVVGSVRWAFEQGSRNGSLLLLASLLLILSLAGVIWMAHPSTDRRIRRSYLYGVLLWAGLSFFPAWYFFGMVTFERVISSALNGEVDPGAVGRVQWAIRSDREHASWLRDLPLVSEVRCVPYSLFPHGACCNVDYQDGRGSEVHIFRTGFRRFTVRKLTKPSMGLCRNPEFDPRAAPGSLESMEFAPCDQLRRS